MSVVRTVSTPGRCDACDERRECILHRGCCRIVMLVASGPAFGASPSAPCLSFRRSIRVRALRPFREPADRHPANRAGVRSRQAGGSAPKSFTVPVWRFRSWLTVCKPAFPGRRTAPNSLACLPSSGVFPLCRSSASSRLPEGCREPANGFAPLAASAVRGADPKVYHACFPILLRASLPYRSD